jgi:hypothetical protein
MQIITNEELYGAMEMVVGELTVLEAVFTAGKWFDGLEGALPSLEEAWHAGGWPRAMIEAAIKGGANLFWERVQKTYPQNQLKVARFMTAMKLTAQTH